MTEPAVPSNRIDSMIGSTIVFLKGFPVPPSTNSLVRIAVADDPLPRRDRPSRGGWGTALRVTPDYADAMFNLALLLQRKNQYAEAADY